MTNRKNLEEIIVNDFRKIMLNKEKELNMYKYAYQKYNFSMAIFSNYVSEREDIKDVSKIDLFIMLDSCEHALEKTESLLPDFFSEKEIEDFQKIKLKEEDLKFPLIFNMIQVASDQWIGSVDAKTISILFDHHLMNYNTETQRTMYHIKLKNGDDHYKIRVDKKAVQQITDELINHTYISDDITLNIPEGQEDFVYDSRSKRLIINSIKTLDIIDGYQRCISINRASILDEDFNYPMELRITHFNTEKLQRFIYQKDQNTKMSTVNSDSYNVYSPQIIIANKVNTSSSCNIKGYIGRNQSQINLAKFSELINLLFLNKFISKTEEQRRILEVTKEIIDDFNILTEEDPSFLDIKYDIKTLTCVMCVFKYMSGKTDKSGISKLVRDVIKGSENINKVRFYESRKISAPTINKIMDIVKGVDLNV